MPFALAARLNLPYDTLATLNGLEGPAALRPGTLLLVPSIPGLYVSLEPRSTFEEIVLSVTANMRTGGREIQVSYGGSSRHVLFFPGEGFSPVERAFFLHILFLFPLPAGILSSGFGTRPNPFDGHSEFHRGVDLAAVPRAPRFTPLGTESSRQSASIRSWATWWCSATTPATKRCTDTCPRLRYA